MMETHAHTLTPHEGEGHEGEADGEEQEGVEKQQALGAIGTHAQHHNAQDPQPRELDLKIRTITASTPILLHGAH